MALEHGVWFTLEAAAYILEFKEKNGKCGPLRIRLEKTIGCGDSKVALGFGETERNEWDTESVQHGLHFVVDYLEYPELDGLVVDLEVKSQFEKKLIYKFSGMTACGCGEAFTPKTPPK
jgi:Fe-S cluster assembly iron-binding protein IscA